MQHIPPEHFQALLEIREERQRLTAQRVLQKIHFPLELVLPGYGMSHQMSMNTRARHESSGNARRNAIRPLVRVDIALITAVVNAGSL